jgi:hypothetical protein
MGTLKGASGILPQRKRLKAASLTAFFRTTRYNLAQRLQHTGRLLGKPQFRAHKPHFQILAKPCNLSQAKVTCGQGLRIQV